MIPFHSHNKLAPMIQSLRKEKATPAQYAEFSALILSTYHVELSDRPQARPSEKSLKIVNQLLQTQKETQALKGFVQRLLLVIYTAREWKNESSNNKIPRAEVWFNPRKANNILAMEKEILALV